MFLIKILKKKLLKKLTVGTVVYEKVISTDRMLTVNEMYYCDAYNLENPDV